MRSEIVKQISDIVVATTILSRTKFVIAGQSSPSISSQVERAMLPETARKFLIYSLQQKLYAHYYSTIPRIRAVRPPAVDSAFVEALSEANAGSGHWEAGWEVIRTEGTGLVVASKNDLTLWLGPNDYETDFSALSAGVKVRVRFGKERRGISPGFYLALGNSSSELKKDVLRFYWNIRSSGAIRLVSSITSLLNKRQIAFQFKIVNSLTFFGRRDAAVLYVAREDYQAATKALSPIYQKVRRHMNQDVPLFTKKMEPGLGFAEDPNTGESFGEQRTRLLAEALSRAYEDGIASDEQRVEVVLKHLRESGVDLEYPYLNPGSRDVYDFELNLERSEK